MMEGVARMTGGMGLAPQGFFIPLFRLYCAMGTLGKLMGKSC